MLRTFQMMSSTLQDLKDGVVSEMVNKILRTEPRLVVVLSDAIARASRCLYA